MNSFQSNSFFISMFSKPYVFIWYYSLLFTTFLVLMVKNNYEEIKKLKNRLSDNEDLFLNNLHQQKYRRGRERRFNLYITKNVNLLKNSEENNKLLIENLEKIK